MLIEDLISKVLLPIVATIVTAGLPILMAYGAKYLKTKTDNEKVHAAIGQLNDLTYTTVLELEKTFERSMEPDKDGRIRLTPEEKAEIKRQAIDKVTSRLSDFTKKQVPIATKSVEDYVSAKIEAFLQEMRTERPAVE